jgi:hypothetical protein
MWSSVGRWHRVRRIQEEGLGGGGGGASRRSSAPSGRLGFVGWGVCGGAVSLVLRAVAPTLSL